VERGPLVYCFEQADQPGDVSVEDIALSPGDLATRDGEVPGIGPTVLVEAHAVRQEPARQGGLPYSGQPEDPPTRPPRLRGGRRRSHHGGGRPLLPVGQPRWPGDAGVDATHRASAMSGAMQEGQSGIQGTLDRVQS
jgi:hypothetical protein